jgi:hypothetical protein
MTSCIRNSGSIRMGREVMVGAPPSGIASAAFRGSFRTYLTRAVIQSPAIPNDRLGNHAASQGGT